MKNIKHINEFLKILENNDNNVFKNEKELKTLLMQNKNFAKGDVHQGLLDIFYSHYSNNIDYDAFLELINEKYGELAEFCVFFASYNYQVCNGGHLQYFDNGYASSTSHGFGSEYNDMEKHEYFKELFIKLNFNNLLKNGKTAYDIISDFDLDLIDEEENCGNCGGSGQEECFNCESNGRVDCDVCGGNGEDDDGEPCGNCDGDGQIECGDCDGDGNYKCEDCHGSGIYESGKQIPDSESWSRLDERWYEINEKVIEEFNNYLKSLTLDGKNIIELIELAKSTQNYNL